LSGRGEEGIDRRVCKRTYANDLQMPSKGLLDRSRTHRGCIEGEPQRAGMIRSEESSSE
jgi:hypothetical protein